MTARQRVLNAVRGMPVDHPAAAPYMGNFAIRFVGMKPSQCHCDPVLMADAQIQAWRFFRQDVIVVQSDNYYMAEAFGAEVIHADDAMPVLKGAVVQRDADVHRLEPVEPRLDGRMPVYIEAIRRIRDAVGENAAIRGCGTGPFVLAGHLCGIERLLVWLAETETGIEDHGDALRRLFGLGLDVLVAFATAQLEAGATIIQLADSLASLQVISPRMYETYVFPYEQAFFSRMRGKCEEYGAVALLHICGDNTRVFGDYVATGADIIAVDHAASLDEAARIIADRACIIGNMNPSGTLLFGTPDEATAEATACLDAMSSHRYLLGTGCEVSVDTPAANMQAMLAVASNRRGGDR